MKITIVVGNAPMFKYLGCEVQKSFREENTQIIVENSYSKENVKKQIKFRIKKYGFFKLLDEVIYRLFESIIQKGAKIYKSYFNDTDSLVVDYVSKRINNKETEQRIKDFCPDIIVIFGTSIVRKNIFSIPKLGTLNIHPGINPKYRGAGNFWALKAKDFSNYGYTIHYVDEGIDTGDIVLCKTVKFKDRHKVLPYMYSDLTLEAVKSLLEILKKAEKEGSIISKTLLTTEEGYNTWPGMTDYLKMRWNNR